MKEGLGLWAYTKITWATHPPTTFNHEEVLKGKSANRDKVSEWSPPTHSGGQVDQVDSKVKVMG